MRSIIEITLAIVVLLLSAPLTVEAQPRSATPRLCFLVYSVSQRADVYGFLTDGLRNVGYVDGRDITIDVLSADGRFERFDALAADCSVSRRTSSSRSRRRGPWQRRGQPA